MNDKVVDKRESSPSWRASLLRTSWPASSSVPPMHGVSEGQRSELNWRDTVLEEDDAMMGDLGRTEVESSTKGEGGDVPSLGPP